MGYLVRSCHRRGLVGASFALAMLLTGASASAQTVLTGGQVTDATWTQAGSPYIIQGDLVVPSGSFLHIEAGVDVQVAETDSQNSLPDIERVAITVDGSIRVMGTTAEPVHVHAQTGTETNTWHGLVVSSQATEAKFEHVLFEHANLGLVSFNPLIEIYASEFATNAEQGVELNDGVARFDRLLLRDNDKYGVRLDGGIALMTNIIARDNGNFGFFLTGGTATVRNATAHRNDLYGFSLAGADADIINTLVTQNGAHGLIQSSGQIDLVTCDVWGNASGAFTGTINAVDVFSTDPEYVDEANRDLHLQSTSVCIDRGSPNGAPGNDFDNVVRPINGDASGGSEHDIGAYEYVAMPICGDTVVGQAETCDDGADNGSYGFCNGTCDGVGPFCGDNNVDAPHEECDDGNTTAGDGCDANCANESMGTGGSGTGGSGTGGQSSGSGGMGAGTSAGGSGTGGANGCVPGEQIACACPNGNPGIQNCNGEGTGFGTCSCGNSGEGSENDSGCSVSAPSPEPAGAAFFLLLGAAALAARRSRD